MFDGTSLNYNGGGGGGAPSSASFSDSVTTGDIIDFQLQHLHYCLYAPNNHLVVRSSHLTVSASRQELLTGESCMLNLKKC